MTSLERLIRPGPDAGPSQEGFRPATQAPPTQAPPARDSQATPAPAEPGAVRRIAADGTAAAVVLAVTPLCLLQAPNAIAWALGNAGGVAAAPGPVTVLRAAGLALPAMAAVAGIAALAAVRFRAWPVLLTGLLVMAGADALGGAARTVATIGAVRVLHGLAAGLALPAALALAWERAPAPRRLLAALWSAATVGGLATASVLTRDRLSSGGWHRALAPYPWLTGVALTVAALYVVLAEGPGASHRAARPFRALGARQDATQERAQLAVLTVPGLGLAALSVAVTYRTPAALRATAAVAILILYGVAAVASADRLVGGPLCLPMVAAVTGLVVAPAAGAVTSLRVLTPGPSSAGPSWLPLAVTAAAVLAGVAGALALRRRPRAVVLAGLVVAVEGLAAARLAGPFAPDLVVAAISAPLAGGLAAAMTAALAGAAAEATAARALSGLSLLLTGLLAGYLGAGAVQVRMVTQLAAAPGQARGAEQLALAGALGVWELAGLVSLVIAIAVIILTGQARRGGAVTRWRG